MSRASSAILLSVALSATSCGGASTTKIPPADEASRCDPASGRNCKEQRAGTASDTNWHPDPDGDGIPSASDRCPNIYDVDQGDVDGDGIGDFCDEDFARPARSGAIVDLRAEHVTPYGGWFSFRSPSTTRYGQDYVIAWSTKAAELRSGKTIGRLGDSSKKVFRVFAYAGHQIVRPQIITAMEPATTYFVAIAPLDDNDRPKNPVSNIARIATAAAPTLRIPAASPRVLATPAQLAELRKRNEGGDRSWTLWAKVMGDSVLEAAASGSQEDFGECLSAALLFHGTQKETYKKAALTFITSMRRYWEANELENNQLRWADANLGLCADLMWGQLSASDRNAVVAAYLDDDEAASIEREVDTDEFASIARTWVIDGLVGCKAEGIEPALSKRACALLERGKRAFYGVQLVKARRNQGFFAQSGGNLPDGIGYGLGTATYWLKALIALGNVGGEVDEYAPWVWNNLQALQIQALTPMRRGLATFGDLDSYDNFQVEANSHPVLHYNGGLIAMHMGLLERAGRVEQAGHARWHMDNLYPVDDFGGTWAMLLFAHDGIAPREDSAGIPTSFHDKSMGMFYDRTSWSKTASYLTFRAGWSGADHAHEDAGAFQFYRNGVWITNEALGYDGPAAEAQGHNVPALEVRFDDGRKRVGQFHLEPDRPARILRAIASARYTHLVADLLGAYTSGRHHSFSYEEVERQLFWLKGDKSNSDDRLFLYDRIVSEAKAKRGTRAWQLHINSSPELKGARASFQAGSYVEVQLVLPGNQTLSYQAPQGKHSQYPGERYTGRLYVEADSADESLHYLALLRASEAEAGQAALSIDTPALVGALSDDDLILFPKSSEDADSFTLRVESDRELRIWWTGLRPETGYTLESRREGGALTLELSRNGPEMTDAAGVLSTTSGAKH